MSKITSQISSANFETLNQIRRNRKATAADRFLARCLEKQVKPESTYSGSAHHRRNYPKGYDVVFSIDEANNRADQTIITLETREKIEEMTKQKRREPRKKPQPFIHRVLTDEEIAEFRARDALQSLHSRLKLEIEMDKRRTLLERMRTPTPPPEPSTSTTPLLQRFTETPTFHFRKTKYSHRVDEFQRLCAATVKRGNPLFEKLNRELVNINDGKHSVLRKADIEYLWDQWEIIDMWTKKLDLWSKSVDEKGYRLSLVKWRHFMGACKLIGNVSFKNMENNLARIVGELLHLKVPIPVDSTKE